MIVKATAVGAGLVLSYLLKDIQFLSLDLHFLNTGLIHPDFLLIFIAFFGLNRGEMSGIWIGFFGGLLEDGTNWIFDSSGAGFNAIIGIHAFVYSLLGCLLGNFRQYFQSHLTSFTILLIFGIAVFSRFCIWFMHGMIDNLNMNYPILGPALYTALLAPAWFGLIRWVYRF